MRRIEHERETETPLTLLQDVIKKLTHEKMEPESLDTFKIEEALNACREIQNIAGELENTFDHLRAKFKKLVNKK